MNRVTFLLIGLLITLPTSAQTQKKNEILWDTYGVPHIYARNIEEMYYAFGWAQMHNHADLLLRLYGQARGRAAEYWGETYRETNRQVHLFELPETARQHSTQLDAKTRNYFEAFIKGINAYAKQHPKAIANELKQVLPVTVPDMLSHSLRVLYLTFLAGREFNMIKPYISPGSNAYAIGASRSASGKAMLVINPHLPWNDLFTWFEAHLTAPDFNLYGASLVGVPRMSHGFNQNLGWALTNNTIDAVDLYELTPQDDGYRLDGKVTPFRKRTVPLQIRQADGSLKTEMLELKYSIHGPVVVDSKAKMLAMRIAEFRTAGSKFDITAKARNLMEFEEVLRLQELPMFNFLYADKEGTIFYLFNGLVPKRPEGDWKFWQGIVDGSQSKYVWKDYHTYDELPRLVNPATGFIQNANDSPWTSTYPTILKPENYPPYMAPQQVPLRPQRAINQLKDDHSITYDELVDYKHSTHMEAADRFLDDLIEAVRQHPDPLAKRAMAVLQQWDRATETHSRGAVLFANWFNRLNPAMFSTPWSPAQPITTPDGLKDTKQAVELLVQSAQEVEKLYGALDVPWGEVYRYKVGTYDVPANGGSERYGIFRTIYSNLNPDNNRHYAWHGDTFVAVVEFGDKPRAQVLLSYGNATQPGNKHVGDQLPLLSEKKLRPAWLDKAEVLQHLEKREVLSISNL
jgi:acyl-homoserine-lactone acylase